MSEEEMKEELKSFSINIDDIQLNYEPFEEIRKAIAIIRQEYLIKNVEVILNGNLLMSKNKLNNYRTIFGARVSLENLDKDVSFIVREDTQPSYEEIQTENTKLKQDNQELKRIVEALEMAKQNMPKGTKFVIVAEEDYLRNIGIINERKR